MYDREVFADEWEPVDGMPQHRIDTIKRQRDLYWNRLKPMYAEAIEQGKEKEFIQIVAGAQSGWPTERPRYKDQDDE